MVYGFLIVKFCERKWKNFIDSVVGFFCFWSGLNFYYGNMCWVYCWKFEKSLKNKFVFYSFFLVDYDVFLVVLCFFFIFVLWKFVFV